MPRENKVTKVMKEQRIFTVQSWLIDAVPNALIIKQIINNWELSRRQAIRYLDEAFKEWNTETAATIEEKRQTRIAWLQNEVRSIDPKFKNTPQGKRTLLAFAKEISKLEALYPPKKIEHSNDPDKPLPIPVIEPIVFTIISNAKPN
jgi:polyhydroxyalkanoate synthesis regulator phasin